MLLSKSKSEKEWTGKDSSGVISALMLTDTVCFPSWSSWSPLTGVWASALQLKTKTCPLRWECHSSECELHWKKPGGKIRVDSFIQCGDQPSRLRKLPHPFLHSSPSYAGDNFELTLIKDSSGEWGHMELGGLMSSFSQSTGSWRIAPHLISEATFLDTGGPVCGTQSSRPGTMLGQHWQMDSCNSCYTVMAGTGSVLLMAVSRPQQVAWRKVDAQWTAVGWEKKWKVLL